MEAVLNKPFNAAQIELMQLLPDDLEEEELIELRKMLVAFQFRLAEERAERVSQSKNDCTEKHSGTSRIVNPDSPMVKGLVKMLQHKKLREQFWLGEITFDAFNKQLLELGIPKQYEHPSAV
jgi:hypothetical protein